MNAKRNMDARERKIVGVVGAAHFFSHFYFLVLPLMFPILYDVYGIGYTELGIGYAVFSGATLICQTPIGFIVDRYGARLILIAGVAVESFVLVLFGVFHTYFAYLILMGIAGIANAVYHPCDYSILTRSVNKSSLGKAFSIHTFCGQMGSASAPVVIVLITLGVEWNHALMLCGVLGLVLVLCLFIGFRSVDIPSITDSQPVTDNRKSSIRLLLSPSILLGWLFFLGYAMSSTGLYDFSVSAFTEIYASPLAHAGVVIWLFLLADAIGILSAGFFAHRWVRHDLVVTHCFIGVAACMFFITFVPMPLWALTIPMVIAGLFYGFIAPSRDVIISQLAPAKDMGKVFGTVTTGFNAGGIIGPPLFGFLLDLGDPYSIFWGAGVIALLSIATVVTPAALRRHGTAVASQRK
ncbi:MAG: MFS transporter [Acidiferrobacterales bacterium]|nr:MFS transporter [Acidiferrobacterales bacterium]